MHSLRTAFLNLISDLQPLYGSSEATAIAHEVLYHLTRLDKLKRLDQKDIFFTPDQEHRYKTMRLELLRSTPIQYVIGAAQFMGREFKVSKHVLIPRPETEELVKWIINDNKASGDLTMLDIGTGSGCIPISLKSALPATLITSVDISPDALSLAAENAQGLHAPVTFLKMDFLDNTKWKSLPTYNVIVSNPPYIPLNELPNIHSNVKDHEPHIALFVPANDPLLFYKAIANFGKTHLTVPGTIYCELHVDHATLTKELFESMGYNDVVIKKDFHGNWRMLRASIDSRFKTLLRNQPI